MEFLDALKILESENKDVEFVNEGKFGRAVSALGIAIGSLFGTSHADIDNLDLKTASSEEIDEIKTAFEQESDISYCKLKSKGLVCRDTNNTITIYPTETLENIGISDDVTEILFLDGYKNSENLSGVVLNYKNGSKKTITHNVGEKYGYITVLDEYDREKSKKIVTPGKVEKLVSNLYNSLVKEVDRPNKREEVEQRILKKYAGKDTQKFKEYKKTQFNDDELSDAQNREVNNIMAKYQNKRI